MPRPKHAVRALSEVLRQEGKPYNIRTTVISPAFAISQPEEMDVSEIVFPGHARGNLRLAAKALSQRLWLAKRGWLSAGNSGGSERCGRGFGGAGFDSDGCGMAHGFTIGF
jgi:NAD(P)-dependent dehydrogenase (short-subunit alcohol dehydrogenase family)